MAALDHLDIVFRFPSQTLFYKRTYPRPRGINESLTVHGQCLRRILSLQRDLPAPLSPCCRLAASAWQNGAAQLSNRKRISDNQPGIIHPAVRIFKGLGKTIS